MDISNPRRVLAVSLEEEAQYLSKVIKELTGSNPEPASTSLAGTSHDLALKTPYYVATVPIWLDLIASPTEWSESFLSEEAGEVLAVLGGLVLVFSLPSDTSNASAERTRELVQHVGQVVKKGLGGWEWDGVGLAVGVGEGTTEEWDEACAEAGLEFVHVTGKAQNGRNEFGEKSGVPRIKEALESNDWSQLDDSGLSDFGDFENGTLPPVKDDPENMDFGYDKADFEGLKKAIWENSLVIDDVELGASSTPQILPKGEDEEEKEKSSKVDMEKAAVDDDDVVRVERMMRKLQAVREAGEGMSEEQRKKMAAKAVRDVMADLDDD